MYISKSTSALLWASSLATALGVPKVMKRSPEAAMINGKHVVSGQAEFDNFVSWTFEGSTLPDGLSPSNYGVGGSQEYVPENVIVRDGYVDLLVNGGQTAMPYTCAEFVTDVTNIKYASVRTVAILTEPAGVCNGIFFYKSETQEIDIEWLSDPESLSNGGTRKLWLINQDANEDGETTSSAIEPPSNPTTTEHEYRIDWTEGLVQWFVDGQQVWETTRDVPSVPGPWVWNNWSNGDKRWTVGPPVEDAIFRIKSIDMYYNTA